MAKRVQLIHMSDGTVITKVMDDEGPPLTDQLIVARIMYRMRVNAGVGLRDAAAYVGLRPSELSAMEHDRAPFPRDVVNKLGGLYAGT